MTQKDLFLSELKTVPNSLITELLDFVYFLKMKRSKQNRHLPILSESSLKKDWLTPEEDQAWQSL